MWTPFLTISVILCYAQGQLQTIPPIDNQVGGCHYGGAVYMAGQSWTASDGCNTCYCSAHAGGAMCTEMACVTTKPVMNVNPASMCMYNGVTYATGDKYMSMDGCNTCSCTQTGVSSCTKAACRRGTCAYNGRTYQVGQMFDDKDGCNTCHCVSHSHVACTEMYCIPFFNRILGRNQ